MIIFRIALVVSNNQIPLEISICRKVIFILWYNVLYSCVLFLVFFDWFTFSEAVLNGLVLFSCEFYLPIIGKPSFGFHSPTSLFKRAAGFLETLLLLAKLIHLIMDSTFLTILIWNVNRILLPLMIKTRDSFQ